MARRAATARAPNAARRRARLERPRLGNAQRPLRSAPSFGGRLGRAAHGSAARRNSASGVPALGSAADAMGDGQTGAAPPRLTRSRRRGSRSFRPPRSARCSRARPRRLCRDPLATAARRVEVRIEADGSVLLLEGEAASLPRAPREVRAESCASDAGEFFRDRARPGAEEPTPRRAPSCCLRGRDESAQLHE